MCIQFVRRQMYRKTVGIGNSNPPSRTHLQRRTVLTPLSQWHLECIPTSHLQKLGTTPRQEKGSKLELAKGVNSLHSVCIDQRRSSSWTDD